MTSLSPTHVYPDMQDPGICSLTESDKFENQLVNRLMIDKNSDIAIGDIYLATYNIITSFNIIMQSRHTILVRCRHLSVGFAFWKP